MCSNEKRKTLLPNCLSTAQRPVQVNMYTIGLRTRLFNIQVRFSDKEQDSARMETSGPLTAIYLALNRIINYQTADAHLTKMFWK